MPERLNRKDFLFNLLNVYDHIRTVYTRFNIIKELQIL